MNKKLGKGLAALLEEKRPEIEQNLTEGNNFIEKLDINSIELNEDQVRKNFEINSIYELAESIRTHGIIQPLIVYKFGDKYKLVAGERRYRAAKILNLTYVPAIIKSLTRSESIELCIIENIQRENLNVVEEADGYLKLMKEFAYTQEEIANKVGKSRSHIANLLRLNNLPNSIKDKIKEGVLTMGHARALLSSEQPEALLEEILDNKLTVRETEKLSVGNKKRSKKQKADEHEEPNAIARDIKELSYVLSEKFGIKAEIILKGEKYQLLLEIGALEDIDSFLDKLNSNL